MPKIQITTKDSSQIWASPDGQRVIYKVTLDYNGSPVAAKTFSKAIATPGWTGEVETYEKDGKFGVETYVKQPPKEGGSYGGGYSGGGKQSGTTGRPMSDPFTMYLSYAKDIKVALIASQPQAHPADKYVDMLDDVLAGAYALYNGRPGAEPSPPEQPKVDTVVEMPADFLLSETQAQTALDKIFDEPYVPGGEKPWPGN